MKTSRAVLGVLLLAGCTLLPGCKRPAHSVKGKVTYKENGKPAGVGGFVMFHSLTNPDDKASGDIEDGGVFELANSEGRGMGAFEGEYEVSVHPRMLEDNPTKSPIDPKYMQPKTSGLKAAIKAGANEFHFQVERNKGR